MCFCWIWESQISLTPGWPAGSLKSLFPVWLGLFLTRNMNVFTKQAWPIGPPLPSAANQNTGGETHRGDCSVSSFWSRRCTARPAQSAWTAPPGTTLLLPPSAPCKHNMHPFPGISTLTVCVLKDKTIRAHCYLEMTALCRLYKVAFQAL